MPDQVTGYSGVPQGMGPQAPQGHGPDPASIMRLIQMIKQFAGNVPNLTDMAVHAGQRAGQSLGGSPQDIQLPRDPAPQFAGPTNFNPQSIRPMPMHRPQAPMAPRPQMSPLMQAIQGQGAPSPQSGPNGLDPSMLASASGFGGSGMQSLPQAASLPSAPNSWGQMGNEQNAYVGPEVTGQSSMNPNMGAGSGGNKFASLLKAILGRG